MNSRITSITSNNYGNNEAKPISVYWYALNYRKNSIIGCRVISSTSNTDLRNLYTVSSAAWKIKATQEKWSNYGQ